jgi:hypothetical protein
MTAIFFTSVPNELKPFFTKNATYFVDRWASIGVAVIVSDMNDDFYFNVVTYKDCISITSSDEC